MINKIEDEQIIIPDQETGEEHLFDILFTFDVSETGKSYMAVVPVGDQDEDEEVEVYAFRYEDNGEEEDYTIFAIDDDEEWDMVEEMLNTYAAGEME